MEFLFSIQRFLKQVFVLQPILSVTDATSAASKNVYLLLALLYFERNKKGFSLSQTLCDHWDR